MFVARLLGVFQSQSIILFHPRYFQYGALGVVLGHEITHGFDNNGENIKMISFLYAKLSTLFCLVSCIHIVQCQ